jgi:hypothetical protein
MAALRKGEEKRHTAATKMNTDSSRSHLIFTLLMDIYNKSKKTNCVGKITMVDLAGSERLKKSEATGEFCSNVASWGLNGLVEEERGDG